MRIIPGVNAEATDIIKGLVSFNVSIMCKVFPPLTTAVGATETVYRYASAPSSAVQAIRETGVYKSCSSVVSTYNPTALLSRRAALTDGDDPSQAWRQASPNFDLLFENEHFEERRYRRLKWVCTQFKHYSRVEATREGLYKLHKYTHGLNDKHVEMELAAPLVVKIDSTSRISYENLFTIAMVMPEAHARKPPEPLMPGVYLDENKMLNVYVRCFSGHADDDRWMKEASLLVAALNSCGKTDYMRDSFCVVSYDSQYRVENVHSEVWVIRAS